MVHACVKLSSPLELNLIVLLALFSLSGLGFPDPLLLPNQLWQVGFQIPLPQGRIT